MRTGTTLGGEARKIIRQACHILSGLGDDALTTT